MWKDIAGYEGHYQVSDQGEVRSIKKQPVVLKCDRQRNGYMRVYLWLGNRKRNRLVHRLVAEAFIPNPLHLSDINHLDEDKENNSISNLAWCTHLQNMNYGQVKTKISKAAQGRIVSEETKQKLRWDTSRRRWLNNGKAERYVYEEDVSSMVMIGWSVGRLKRR